MAYCGRSRRRTWNCHSDPPVRGKRGENRIGLGDGKSRRLGAGVSVTSTRLPSCPDTDLLKVDTEGKEVAIVSNYLAMRQKPLAIVCEYHSQECLRELIATTQRHGYRCCRCRATVPNGAAEGAPWLGLAPPCLCWWSSSGLGGPKSAVPGGGWRMPLAVVPMGERTRSGCCEGWIMATTCRQRCAVHRSAMLFMGHWASGGTGAPSGVYAPVRERAGARRSIPWSYPRGVRPAWAFRCA